jgi:hypothetical protein
VLVWPAQLLAVSETSQNLMEVQSSQTISGTGTQLFEAENRVNSGYWRANIFRIREVGTEKEYLLTEKSHNQGEL